MTWGHPLAKVSRVGQPWHGVYSAAGLTLDAGGALKAGWNHNIGGNSAGWETYYLAFGMPAVTASAEETAAGMAWKNDAILHGHFKYYAGNPHAAGTVSFGPNTWLYRAADGTVFRLGVSLGGSSGTVQAQAPVLGLTTVCSFTVDTDGPWTGILGAIGIDWLLVNQSPNGAKACAVAYGAESVSLAGVSTFDRPRACNSVIEFTVTGGSATTWPTVTASVLYDSTTSSTQWNGSNGYDRDFETILLAGYDTAGTRQVVSFFQSRRYVVVETPMSYPYDSHSHETTTIQYRIKVNGASVFDAPTYVFDVEQDNPNAVAPPDTPRHTVASEANVDWYDCYFLILSNCLAALTKPAPGNKFVPERIGHAHSLYGAAAALDGTDFTTYQVAALNPRDGRVATGPSAGFV